MIPGNRLGVCTHLSAPFLPSTTIHTHTYIHALYVDNPHGIILSFPRAPKQIKCGDVGVLHPPPRPNTPHVHYYRQPLSAAVHANCTGGSTAEYSAVYKNKGLKTGCAIQRSILINPVIPVPMLYNSSHVRRYCWIYIYIWQPNQQLPVHPSALCCDCCLSVAVGCHSSSNRCVFAMCCVRISLLLGIIIAMMCDNNDIICVIWSRLLLYKHEVLYLFTLISHSGVKHSHQSKAAVGR